jgi:membrane associated rhomboid family serine protease
MSDAPTGAGAEQTVPTCYRHAGREAHVLCQRCGRNICGDCMRQASVGFQCPDCVKEGARSVRQPRTAYGGRRVARPGLVTLTLIGVNVLVFLAILSTGSNGSALLSRLWLLPVGPCAGPESPLTSGCPPQWVGLEGVADGAVWQLLTSMFTHVQVWHVGFNMLALYILGPQLELMLGRTRFLALYLLSGLFGSATVYWLAPEFTRTVGASGAVFGLMAALIIVALKVRGDVQGLLVLVGINVVITVWGRGFISWQGHLGGFVGGLLLALALVYAPKARRTLWQAIGVSVVAAVIVVGVALRSAALNEPGGPGITRTSPDVMFEPTVAVEEDQHAVLSCGVPCVRMTRV